jgi:PAS domain S-box-containing protein
LLASRSDFARAQLQLITELPVFLASMGDPRIRADEPTVSAMAEHYRAQLLADLCVVSDNLGHHLGHAAVGQTDMRRVDLTTAGDPAQPPSPLQELGGDLYLVVSVPAVFDSEDLGTLTAAYRLNDALARELTKATHTDVSFLVNGRLVASSLSPAIRSTIQSAGGVLAQPPSARTGAVVDIADGRYVLGHFPLSGSGASRPGALLLMADWGPSDLLLEEMRARLIWVAVGTFGCAIGAMVFFSRRVSTHMRVVANAALKIASGQWHQKVPRAGSAEAVLVADAFNAMTASLVHWHHEAETRLAGIQLAYERFSAVTRSASDAIISVDAAGAIAFWSPGAERLFGYTEAEATGEPFMRLVAPSDRRTCQEYVQGLTTPEPAGQHGVRCEFETVSKDGRTFVSEASLAPWRTAAGPGMTAVMRDATARIETHRHLENARQEAERASQAKSRFVANMSHELRTPLNSIIGYSELLAEDAEGRHDGGSLADIEKITTAGRHLLALVTAVLDISKIEAEQMTLEIEPFDVEDLIREVASTATPLITANGNAFEVIASNVGGLTADRLRVQQVLLNLLSNAGKFTKDGTVWLSAHRDARACIFEVRDTGIGIAEADVERVFQQFSQADDTTVRR